MNYFAGVGRRMISTEAAKAAEHFSKVIYELGWILRSGAAHGADSAFEKGAGTEKEIFLPNEATPEAIQLASKFHPAWHNCSSFARDAHGRNSMILLGRNLNKPVKFVIYISRIGEEEVTDGGTGLALAIARAHNIPTFHLNKLVNRHNILVSTETLVNNIIEKFK